jgi:conjugative transposon TraJ protein
MLLEFELILSQNIAFAFSCYDGLHNSLTHWLARYINIYLWLPVSNLLGAILADIQLNMLQLDLAQAQSGSLTLFSPTDFAYLIFLVIGIVGYFTVPGIANYIVHTHGGNPLAQKVGQLAGMAVKATVGAATGGAGGAAMATGGSGGGGGAAGAGFQSAAQAGNASQFNRDKIAG